MSASEMKNISEISEPMNIDSNEPDSMKLTSLDDDCLEHLFGYLDTLDLMNVADSTKQVHNAACVVFKRKYCSGKVIIGGGHNYKKR